MLPTYLLQSQMVSSSTYDLIAHCAHVVVLMYHHGKHYMRFSNFNEVQMQATFQIGKKSPLGESCCSASISEAAQEVGSTSL